MRKALFPAAAALVFALAACGETAEAPAPAATDAATASASVAAVVPVSAEDAAKVAKERHEGFETIGKSFKTVMDQLKSGAPDRAKVQAAAATINDLAPKVAGWFPAGSGPDVVPKTEALPAIWEKPAEFSAAAQKFVDEAALFNRTAMATDGPALAAGAKALGGACKGCHEQFRKPDDR